MESVEGSFTFGYYRAFLSEAIRRGYRVLSLGDYSELADAAQARVVIICHDLCFTSDGAAEMADLEAAAGATASYFVRVTSRDWNPFAPDDRTLLRNAAAKGHEIGLHFHQASVELGLDADVRSSVEWQQTALEQALGVRVRSMSIHGSWTIYPNLDVFGFDPKGLPTNNYEYDRRFHDGFVFIQDGAGQMMHTPTGQKGVPMWPHEAIDTSNRIHLLLHPMWWTHSRADALRRW